MTLDVCAQSYRTKTDSVAQYSRQVLTQDTQKVLTLHRNYHFHRRPKLQPTRTCVCPIRARVLLPLEQQHMDDDPANVHQDEKEAHRAAHALFEHAEQCQST